MSFLYFCSSTFFPNFRPNIARILPAFCPNSSRILPEFLASKIFWGAPPPPASYAYVCDVIYKTVYLDFPKYFFNINFLCYFGGIDTLCSIISNSSPFSRSDATAFPFSQTAVTARIEVSKLVSYGFYCFMNFLCIYLFFRPFVFVFSAKFVADTL